MAIITQRQKDRDAETGRWPGVADVVTHEEVAELVKTMDTIRRLAQ